MKLTLINSELTAEIDEADAHLSTIQWSLVRKRDKQYACGRVGGRRVYLHRLIVGAPQGQIVDHYPDPNGLNCRRSNLRVCTRSQNMGNSCRHSDSKGTFKGVYFECSRRATKAKYVAQICVQGKRIKIGRFDNAEDAARAYDAEAIKQFGEFAKVNFPDNPLAGLDAETIKAFV